MAEKKEKFQNCWYCTSESCMKNCFDGVVFQDAVCEDFSLWRLYVLVNVSGVFTFSFSYCFYDGFILFYFFLLFLSAICLLKVFRFDTAILRDPCAVLLLKTLWKLPQGVAFSCLIIFSHVCLQYFPFRAIVTVICWISLEVLLNPLLLPWIQLCILMTLSKLMFSELPVLILLVLYLICSVLGEGSLSCIPRIRFKCSFFWPWVNQYMVHGFDSISIGQFPAMGCLISAKGSLNRVPHLI